MATLGCDFSGFDLTDVYADDIGDVQKLAGGNFRSIFFVWRADGGIVRKVPVLSLIRPIASLTGGEIRRWLREIPDPSAVRNPGGLHS